ncbi:MAG: hypothetical protein H0Z40_01055 [Desulfotomaculum sp.]|nr:hypothetical protein [Desulfotomaculum sp.]
MSVWLAVLALLLGVLSLVLEVFIFPGFGVAGLTGLILMSWGILLLSTDILQSLQGLVIALAATIALFAWGVHLGYKRKLWHKLTLGDRQNKDLGYHTYRPELQELQGKKGIAVTKLRPAGTAEIDGKRVDVVSEGGYIPPGSELKVVRVEGTKVMVKKL